jgi:ubiquinone/menaquinone biosynthesis C-methylase UbiE
MASESVDRRGSVVESFDDYLDAFARLDGLMSATPEPRSAAMLLDVAALAGVSLGEVVLDAGCRDGTWPARLSERFGCRVIGVDLARRRLREAREQHALAVCEADVAALPVASESVGFVWCREVLSLVADPRQCLREYRRVLRRGGALISWEAYPTALLSDDERAWFFAALDAPEWWKRGRPAFDDALSGSGLSIAFETAVAPESTEWLALHRPDELLEAIIRVAKMRRQRAAYEAELGHWYPRMLAWETWPLYLLLGKLQTYALVLRSER